MYPVLFRIGDFEITSFGVLVAIAALVGLSVFARELRRSGLPEEGANAAAGGVIGGLVGAKVIWSLEFAGTAPFTDLLFSRGGLSWFGGFVGGISVGLWLLGRDSIPILSGAAAAVSHPNRLGAGCGGTGAGVRACHRTRRLFHGG